MTMKTAITELFDIQYPILNAGMGRVALPEMVAAVSNAGGLGVLGAGSSPPELTRQMIREIRTLTNKPFAANTALAIPNGIANAKVCIEEQIPVINYSMGKGDWICKAVHEYGGKVMASVTDQKLAIKAQQQGCDAIIAAGYEAAGHSGSVTTFTLIPRLVEVLDIPVIAAGGIVTGSNLIAALALGAAGVSMGTRFWTTQEAPMHHAWKEKAVELDVTDTLYSTKFDGIPCRQMDVPAARKMMEARMFNVFGVLAHSFEIAKELNIPWPRLMLDTVKKGPREIDNMMRMSQMLKAHTLTMTSADTSKGFTAVGMSVGLVHDIPTIAELMDRIVVEAQACQARLARNALG
jgi:enoyl-[acyl-carrier protein] reductase II